ncbi:hypothetical protein Vadar_032365 [Vaccinium darrowii]|uniref:Uncharacterized protein n=1 Tax=Vaccinium darrowii TaxID=229202 RepID=A0ACB7XWJ8_9ERIC|nr:hypothetical protein Vadar_032365 [Vaccinium darrowii]
MLSVIPPAPLVVVNCLGCNVVRGTSVAMENSRLREEVIVILATKMIGKQIVVELAVVAMEELMQMAQMGDPLGISGTGNNTCVLNEEEYFRTYTGGIGPKPLGFRSEASRETTVVTMNHVNLVEILLDVVNVTFCAVMLIFFNNKLF